MEHKEKFFKITNVEIKDASVEHTPSIWEHASKKERKGENEGTLYERRNGEDEIMDLPSECSTNPSLIKNENDN